MEQLKDFNRELAEEMLQIQFDLISEDVVIRTQLYYICLLDRTLTPEDQEFFNKNKDAFDRLF